jgi:hypothetical protein
VTLNKTGITQTDAQGNVTDVYLIFLCFAKQSLEFENGITFTYQEFFPAIPNVSLIGSPDVLLQAIPVLWVNNVAIAQGARNSWKMNKLVGKFSESERFPLDVASGLNACSNAVIANFQGPDLGYKDIKVAAAKLEATATTNQNATSYAPFAPFLKLMSTPMTNWAGDDLFVSKYAIDFSTAKVGGAKVSMELGNLFGLPAGAYEVDSLDATPFGAFTLDFKWTLEPVSPYPKLG